MVQGGASEAAGAIAATASVSQEMLGWQAAVGKSFRISSTAGSVAGKLVSVAGAPVVGARPASIRQQPFWLKFEFDSGYAAASDDIYFVESGVTTATNLFLQRGEAGLFAALLN